MIMMILKERTLAILSYTLAAAVHSLSKMLQLPALL